MNGSIRFNEEEKWELLQEDARNIERGKAFSAARMRSQAGRLDEYIDFLSEHTGFFPFEPTRRVTDRNRL